eukprot:CAMPEP_0197636586 /NCGR_PEP_ID=MMETSP1338-20131121/12046_1 /TAXON_ID=43686 ORGANISM="Pelagodinium beii, Strain RCC1491" /NCGR_SAMPLE_ID=MMETSP1338 /ASSEMBLY_ACC=CAM_ASM_000754 /LENGTH=314 /DNA_ID=CAMNT_0043208835 /DNA_START=38 /DNA_END=978 /DNA_ORIENTATION=-
MAKDVPKGTGRVVMDATDSILWTQRIEKEDKVNGIAKGQFSVRAAVNIVDVPSKFKPGHVNPTECMSKEGFDPAKHGWDPDGKEAREFRRCMAMAEAGPRSRYAYPETSNHEHGWLLMPDTAGDHAARAKKNRVRYGLGWEWKAPEDWSQSAVEPPLVSQPKEEKVAGSTLSAIPPSTLSGLAPSQLAALQTGSGVFRKSSQVSASAPAPPSTLSVQNPVPPADQRSTLSAAAPSGTSSVAPASSVVSKSSSLPALMQGPAHQRLQRREQKLVERFKESHEFSNKGARGFKWYRGLGQTDVTTFHNDFAKATGG